MRYFRVAWNCSWVIISCGTLLLWAVCFVSKGPPPSTPFTVGSQFATSGMIAIGPIALIGELRIQRGAVSSYVLADTNPYSPFDGDLAFEHAGDSGVGTAVGDLNKGEPAWGWLDQTKHWTIPYALHIFLDNTNSSPMAEIKIAPPLLLFLLALIGWSTDRLIRRRIQRRGGRCTSCSYDLRSCEGKCPECGTLIAKPT
ncbi:MAG: hypothetical protein AAF823_12230 [Planctomycetota bacterium]